LTNRVLVYTGTISYGLYLLHKIAFDGWHRRSIFACIPSWPCRFFSAGATTAALSWNLFEHPFLPQVETILRIEAGWLFSNQGGVLARSRAGVAPAPVDAGLPTRTGKQRGLDARDIALHS
jgi:peptidoglycan/LPS O-acetylase OafA/YrhL